MRFIALFFYLFVTLSPGPIDAQTVPQPLIPPTIQVSEKPILPPDILNLKPGWWKYISSAQGENLEDRLYILRTQLADSIAPLPPKEQKAAILHVEKIVANLNAFSNFKNEARNPATKKTTTLAEKYNLMEILTLAEKSRIKRNELTEVRTNREQLSFTVQTAQQYLDNLMAAYQNLPSRSSQRIVQGLQIIATQSALAVTKEKTRLIQVNFRQLQNDLDQLQEEFKHASQNLSAAPEDLQDLKRKKEKAEKVAETAYRTLMREEAAALGVSFDTPKGMAQFQMRSQKAIRAAVEEAHSRVLFERLNLGWHLTALLLRSPEFNEEKFQNELMHWESETKKRRKSIEIWEAATQQNYNQINEILSLQEEGRDKTEEKELFQKRLKEIQDTLVILKRLNITVQTTRVLVELSEKELGKKQGLATKWWSMLQSETAGIKTNLGEWVNKSLFTIGENPISILGLLVAVLINLAAFWISKLTRWLLEYLGKKRKGLRKSSLYVLGRLLHYHIIALGVVISLSSLGLDFTNLAIIVGALSVGIGFGLQTIFNNFVSGLILLFERPLKIGDFVELESGVRGEVMEINVRSTRITTRDNLDVLVPNSEFINGRVINWTLDDPSRRIHVPFGVAFQSNTELLQEVIVEAALAVSYTLKSKKNRQPDVWLKRFGDSRLEYELIVWIRPVVAKLDQELQAEYLRVIEATLRQHQIEVSYPQRDLHLRTVFGKKDWEEF
ncbi:MAG: mechanosensitive ion channel [SAR324 cluster bacterium]|nr:mechanosensitive ion channel [SAR324 cluster bacterium]